MIDTSVSPEVASTVRELFVSARDVHFPDPAAKAFKLHAVLPKASALTVEGELRPGNNGDFTLSLRKFGVSLRDPSSFDRDFGMPIDLALALLRDPAGDITLSIPVKIDEKGAHVSTGAIIASAFKAALLGAVTAPRSAAAKGRGKARAAHRALRSRRSARSPAARNLPAMPRRAPTASPSFSDSVPRWA